MIRPERISNSLIVGASQGIGLALARQILTCSKSTRVIATYRESSSKTALTELKEEVPDRLQLFSLDIAREAEFAELAKNVASSFENLSLVINCIGALNARSNPPERRIEELVPENFVDSFEINTLPTLLLAKHLKPQLRASSEAVFCALSAKVGSLSDNRTGGWYSYRASKAALNMAIKNLSIEFARFNKNLAIIALHPGTTESQLSAPFLEHAKKKYTVHKPEQTAKNLLGVISSLSVTADSGKFLSWDGSEIGW